MRVSVVDAALFAFAVVVLFALSLLVAIAAVGRRRFGGHADIGVVLGTRVHPNGQLSRGLRARVEAGAGLVADGRVDRLLVSGATGREGVDEALAMRAVLLALGVTDVCVDSAGVNTEASAANAAVLVRGATVVVVSQWFHLLRARSLFRMAGVNVVGTHSPAYFTLRDVYSVTREIAAFVVEVMLVEVMLGGSRPHR